MATSTATATRRTNNGKPDVKAPTPLAVGKPISPSPVSQSMTGYESAVAGAKAWATAEVNGERSQIEFGTTWLAEQGGRDKAFDIAMVPKVLDVYWDEKARLSGRKAPIQSTRNKAYSQYRLLYEIGGLPNGLTVLADAVKFARKTGNAWTRLQSIAPKSRDWLKADKVPGEEQFKVWVQNAPKSLDEMLLALAKTMHDRVENERKVAAKADSEYEPFPLNVVSAMETVMTEALKAAGLGTTKADIKALFDKPKKGK